MPIICLNDELCRFVPYAAMAALAKVWIATCIHGPLPLVQQRVILTVRANNEIARSVICLVLVKMVDLLWVF